MIKLVLLIAAVFISCNLKAAVNFDCAFEHGLSNTAGPYSFVSSAGTVACTPAANANRVLIANACFAGTVTGVAMTWNSVSMTAINNVATTVGARTCFAFGLINPVSGAQTLSASWSGGTFDVVLSGRMYYNADQTTGWNNATTSTGTSTAASITVTTTSGDIASVVIADNNSSSATVSAGTQDFYDRNFDGNYGGGHNAAVGSSTVLSWTLGTSQAWAMLGVNVMQIGSAVAPAIKRTLIL